MFLLVLGSTLRSVLLLIVVGWSFLAAQRDEFGKFSYGKIVAAVVFNHFPQNGFSFVKLLETNESRDVATLQEIEKIIYGVGQLIVGAVVVLNLDFEVLYHVEYPHVHQAHQGVDIGHGIFNHAAVVDVSQVIARFLVLV